MKRMWLIAVVVAVYVFANFNANATPPKVDQLLSESISEGKELNYYEIVNAYDEYFANIPEDQRGGWKQYQRWKSFTEDRINPDGTFPSNSFMTQQAQSIQKYFAGDQFQSVTWDLLGPTEEPKEKNNSTGVGRVNCLRFHPNNQEEIWVGAAAGGVWKSTNAGDSWNPVTPLNQFQAMGVTDLAIAPSAPNVIYVATGDAHGANSTGYDTYSIGIIKSTDGGNSWAKTNLTFDLSSASLIGRVLVHPENENIVLAATKGGILKSTDGGYTWEQKQGTYYFIDMEFKTDDPNVIIASTFTYNGGEGFIYRSTNAGDSWNKVYTVNGAKRITLAVTESETNYIYALSGFWQDDNFNSFDLSTDAGKTWIKLADRNDGSPNILGRYGSSYNVEGQAWYDLAVGVSPTNSEIVFTGGIDIWKSQGLSNFTQSSDNRAEGGLPFVHADIHDLQFTPDGTKVYAATDGGVAVSTNNGVSWTSKNSGLAITQYYKFAVAANDEDYIIAGSQDNGTVRFRNDQWEMIMSGDGMDGYIDPNNNSNVIASVYYGEFYVSNNFGNSFNSTISASQHDKNESAEWTAPLAFSESNPNVVVVGLSNVYRSTSSGGKPWDKISNFPPNRPLVVVAIAPSNPNVVYAARRYELFMKFGSGIADWKQLTPPGGFGAKITDIKVDPNNPERFWVTLGQFNANTKVLEYDGEEWINKTGNLPNVPVNCIVYQNNSPDRLYIGTDLGVWYSDYNSGVWEPYGNDIPYTIVADLELHYATNQIFAGTHGRGIWKAEMNQCNLPQPVIEADGPIEICAGETVTLSLSEDYSNFTWSTGSTANEITVGETGSYYITIQDPDGCSATSNVMNVVVNDFEPMTISTGDYAAFCDGQNEEVSLIATFGFKEYEWNTGETTPAITVTEEGEYYVTGTTTEGCKSTSEVYNVLSANPPDAPEIKQRGRDIFVDDVYSKYRWYKNGDLMFQYKEHDIKQFDPEWVGDTITVEVTDNLGCSATSTKYPILSGVNDNDTKELITVTPNPGHGIYTLKASLIDNKNIDIVITNMLGQEVFAKRNVLHFGSVNYDIDISSQPAGVYILNISGKEFSWNTKLIKE